MFTENEVRNYIDTNILHSEPYDASTEKQRIKANNQAWNTLIDFIDEEEITLKDLSEQVVFIFKIDSAMQRAELGVNFITVDGVQMTIRDKERTLAPGVMRRHNISSSKRRKVGRYVTDLSHTFRYGNGA